jgi:hypothetical protein
MRSRNHYCRGKAKSITHSNCVFIVLGIKTAVRIRCVILSFKIAVRIRCVTLSFKIAIRIRRVILSFKTAVRIRRVILSFKTAVRIRRVILSSMACLAVSYFYASFHRRYVFRKKKLLNIQCVF